VLWLHWIAVDTLQIVQSESPRLAVTALVRDEHTFAAALDRAIQRSNEGKVLELAANEPEGPQ
jgi:hypothetical protein